MSPQHFKGCPIGFGEASAWGGAARPSSQPMTHHKSAPTTAAWRHWSSLLKGRVHGFCRGLRENRILFQPTQALKRMKKPSDVTPKLPIQTASFPPSSITDTAFRLQSAPKANFKLLFFNPLGNQRFEWTVNYISSQHRIPVYNCILGQVNLWEKLRREK